MTDFHDLIHRMADELDHYRIGMEGDDRSHPLAREARSALSQPEPEVVGPSDDDLALIYHDCCRGCEFMDQGGFEDAARAVLARYGRPAPAPVEGEVAELVEFLLTYGDYVMDNYGDVGEHELLDRAADLLQRQSAPVPVAVSERLPGDQLCWWFEVDEDCGYGSNWTLLRIKGSATGYAWLPANALPLPSGEVEG